jgi:hypothetical protein
LTRAPVDTITAPAFLAHLEWLGSRPLHMHLLVDEGPVLLEFWDFCRPNSMRTLPYLKAWHARYGASTAAESRARRPLREEEPRLGTTARPGGRLTVVGIHSPGFPPSADGAAVAAAVERLGIEYPVLLDGQLEMWQEYENEGWPARYLFDGRGRLFEYHYGEGDYAETELAIQELLGVERAPVDPRRPEDAPGALLRMQSEDRAGPYSGPYGAGGVWVVLDGAGTVRAHSRPTSADRGGESSERVLSVSQPGAYELFEHPRHTAAELELEVSPGVICHATCFTPGLA